MSLTREQEIREGAAAQLGKQLGLKSLSAHTVGWDKYEKNQTLTSKHVQALSRYDKKDVKSQEELLNDPNTGSLVAEGLTLLLSKGSIGNAKDQTYVLMLIDNMLENNRSRVSLFRDLKTVNPYKKFLEMIPEGDEQQARLVTKILAILHYPGLGHGPPVVNKELGHLAAFARDSLSVEALKKGDKKTIDLMIDFTSCFMIFLREDSCRKFVNEGYNLDRHLSAFLGHALTVGNVQLLYQVGFCLWLLSYDKNIAESMSTTDVVVNMLKVMKGVSKEKVIRVCLACLRNLVDKAGHNQTMIDNNAMKQLAVLRNRKWSDEEVREDLDFISDALAKSVHVLSSIDMYKQEIAAGKMEWTPVHKSETFWRDNATKLCPVGGSVSTSEDLLSLIELLNQKIDKTGDGKPGLNSEEATTVAVICHDLGEFARFHPQGKKILQGDGAIRSSKASTKDVLMTIMSSPPGGNEEIGKQALTCIHKMMVTNWQFLESR